MISAEDILRYKKEKAKQDYIRKDRITDILKIPIKKRTPEEESELIELLVDYPCF